MIQKNEQFELMITDMSSEGLGIGRLDGFVWFVKDAVIGDRVLAAATKLKKNYGFARLLRVLDASSARVQAVCPIARQCGGCQLQALSYEAQLRFKTDKAKQQLMKLGGLSEADWARCFEGIIGMDEPFRYRNKAQFPIAAAKDGQIIAGFYAGRTHSVIPCEDCALGAEENQLLLGAVLNWMRREKLTPYDELSHSGLVRHVLLRKGFHSGQLMLCLVINDDTLPDAQAASLLSGLRSELPQALIDRLHSVSYSVNTEHSNVIMGKRIVNLYGPGYIEDNIGDICFRISPLSFFQVNPVQTEKLYATALEYAQLSGGELVWDVYCGIGTISLFLAQKAGRVYGVEIIPEAIQDAQENARRNGFANTEFFVGAAESVLPEWAAAHPDIPIDVICVDPPRKGCDTACLDTILKLQPKRLVYVSCDAATLARDLRYLSERGYRLERVRLVDMFPQTVHVETVVLLSKLNAKQHIEVELNLDELDLTAAESKATYDEIKAYVLEKYGLKVSSLYISQVKRKCGLDVGQNYNLSKKENAKVSQCPPKKEAAIMEALKHFQMI